MKKLISFAQDLLLVYLFLVCPPLLLASYFGYEIAFVNSNNIEEVEVKCVSH